MALARRAAHPLLLAASEAAAASGRFARDGITSSLGLRCAGAVLCAHMSREVSKLAWAGSEVFHCCPMPDTSSWCSASAPH